MEKDAHGASASTIHVVALYEDFSPWDVTFVPRRSARRVSSSPLRSAAAGSGASACCGTTATGASGAASCARVWMRLRQKHPGYLATLGSQVHAVGFYGWRVFVVLRARSRPWTGPAACTARWSWRPEGIERKAELLHRAEHRGRGLDRLREGDLARQQLREPGVARRQEGDARHDHHDPRVDREEGLVERPRRARPPSRARAGTARLQVLPVQQDEDGVAPRRRELEQQYERGRHLEERAPS